MSFKFLKGFFENFLKKRHIARHFRRLLLSDTVTRTDGHREVPDTLSKMLLNAAKNNTDNLFSILNTRSQGLSAEEAEIIRERVGLNEVEHEKPLPWWLYLWHCYTTPLIYY